MGVNSRDHDLKLSHFTYLSGQTVPISTFTRALIGQVESAVASTIYLRAADETNSPAESLDFQKFKAFLQKYTHFWVSEWYILKQLFTTVPVKVVDIHPHFVE